MTKILVVEDNPYTFELIKMVLKPPDYQVFNDPTGGNAAQLCKTVQPDIILLDVALPEMDGYSIQTKLLEDEKTKNIPIVVMTSKHQVEELFQTAQNVVGFIPKPFHIEDLVKKVKQILEKSPS
jgi:CheY-like chemotaxis protein